MLGTFGVVIMLLIKLSCASDSHYLSPQCYHRLENTELVCSEMIDSSFLEGIAESTKLIVFTSDNLACDCALKKLVEWKEAMQLSRQLTLEGVCFSPEKLSGRSVGELSSEEVPCVSESQDDLLVRKRRAVQEAQNETQQSGNRSYTPGAPVLPCDFQGGFCQWFQLTDDEFHWTRIKGPTNSTGTGPDVDHTSGTLSGYYIHIETSLPRVQGHKARLVSPTLAPVEANSTCQMDLYIHMKGNHIGALNIYQAPVVGFAVTKLSLTSEQGNNWFKKQIQFDSDRVFQVIIEGVRGSWYQGDIAIDDIRFSPGCMRLAPSFVRLVDGAIVSSGRVEIYHKGEWGPVCREGWDQASSSVACRELGYGKAVSGANRGLPLQSDQFTGLYNVSCVGNETSIKNCPSGAWSNSISCPSNSSATVECSGILPVCPLETHFYCPADSSGAKKCISRAQICDFINDCSDGSDELSCENYTRCDFNDSRLCGWIQARNDQMNWTRHKGSTNSPATGPTADHTGNRNAYYLYMNVRNRQGGEKARILVTPRFQGNNNGLCKMRFFYHMYGYGIGTLRVIAADRYSQRTIWSKSYQQSIDWTRAEVQLANMSSSFVVTFEGEHAGGNPYGDIAIDDVSFTPECRPAPHENVTCNSGTLPCGSGECIPLTLQCDFNDDCFDGTDELNCGVQTPGRCDFETSLCHWQNMTDDDFDWQRFSGNTATANTGPTYDHTRGFGGQGHYMYIEASYPRKYGDKARLISTEFMWTNVANCQLRFYYHMRGLWGLNTIGSLRVKLRNTITGVDSAPIWDRFGHQGSRWIRANVPINTTWPVTQVIFEAERGLTYHGDIAIDDVSFSPECYPTEAVHIYKNYDVRLTDGKEGSFEGRVEIYRVGSWGTICDDDWSNKDAQVVCKQLGYADVKTIHEKSYFGEGKGRIWLDNLACNGNETNLGQCLHNGWGNHDCTHKQDAGVVCDKDAGSKTQAVRLRSNNIPRGGRVEIYRSGSWEAVCLDEWDLNDAFVACRQLGYPGADRIIPENGTNNGVSLKNVHCNGHENTLGDCIQDWSLENCNYGNAGVVCSAQGTAEGNIRLTGGSSEKEGRLEVFHRGEWGTVCDDLWTRENARIVCHELGFTSVEKMLQSFGPGSGPVWLEQVGCHGNETAFVDCPNRGWGATSCTHREDVGVICSDQAYIGCYRDTSDHVMKLEFKGPSMTPVSCLRRCQSKGHKYAGLEWANECYCGDHYDRYGNSTLCNLPCYGDATKICGGPWSLSVYGTDPAIIPTAIPGQVPVTQSCARIRHIIGIFPFQQTLTTKYFGGDHRLGWISSPRFPSTYETSTLCIWVVTLLPGTRVNITFSSFKTEYRYDTVKVRDGEKHYSQLLTPSGGFSGVRFASLEASSNRMWIQFSSDSSINQQGFNLTYRALGGPTAVTTNPPTTTPIPPSELPSVQMVEGGCNGISHAVNTTFGYLDWYQSSGFVRSPGYPLKYPDNLVCRWSVRVAPGFRILVTVKHADVAHATQSGGLGDTLQVDDGITRKTSHGQSVPWEFLSAGDLVRVIFIADAMNSGEGFYLQYERVSSSYVWTTKPAEGNTIAPNKGDREKGTGMGGGKVAAIVVSLLIVIVVIIVVVAVFLMKKKKRMNRGVRHHFVNEAYDNFDAMAMTPTTNTPEYANPITPNRTQTAGQSQTDQGPVAYFAAPAPPPYSQATNGGIYLVPFVAAPREGMPPPAFDNSGYASLHAPPPAYQARATSPANGITTTGIGSVTSLREAAKDDGVAAPMSAVSSAPAYAPLFRGVLPPIRGTNGAAEPEKKQSLHEDEAGPLPEKPPLTVNTPPEPTAPPRPPSARSQIRLVAPVTEPEQDFDVEVPYEFLCPLSHKIMQDPVTASDGNNYERKEIRRWFRKKRTSPMTYVELSDLTVRANDDLRRRIEQFTEEHSQV